MITFQQDHRTTNPGLHDLYVGWAIETLRVLNIAIEELASHSRWPSTECVQVLIDKRKELCFTDAAFFEAAALMHIRADAEMNALVEKAIGERDEAVAVATPAVP